MLRQALGILIFDHALRTAARASEMKNGVGVEEETRFNVVLEVDCAICGRCGSLL